MKTAGRENPIHGVRVPRNRAHGAVGQNRSRSIKWAAKQEKFQPEEMCFFLTSSFIGLTRQVEVGPANFDFLIITSDPEDSSYSLMQYGGSPECRLVGSLLASSLLLLV